MSGSYCGPYWSDGKIQKSVAGKATAEHAFDATCKAHDRKYAEATTKEQLNKADSEFVAENMGKGVVRSIAAALVSANRIGRAFVPEDGNRLRGAAKAPPQSKVVREPDLTKDQLITLFTKLSRKNRIMTNKNNKKKGNTSNKKLGAVSAAYSKTMALTAPTATTRGGGRTVIKHREYLGPVVGSTTLRVTSYNLNPGLAASFPWMSQVATNYEKYMVKKLSVQYVTSSGSTTGGRVGLAFGYNPSEADPTSKSEFFSIVPNVEEAPWEDINMTVPPTGEVKYVRFGGISSGTVNTYDMGKIIVIASNTPDSESTIGELFVDYEIELSRPHYGRVLCMEAVCNGATSGSAFGSSLSTIRGVPMLARESGNVLRFLVGGNFSFVYTALGTGPPTYSGITYSAIPGSNGSVTLDVNTVAADAQTLKVLFSNVTPGDVFYPTGSAWGLTQAGFSLAPFSIN
jgi:hypothetical protein